MKVEGQTKITILRQSLEIFARKGYEGTSMSDIAAAVGIRKASLYSHFPGKESIFRLILDSILEEHAANITRIVEKAKGSAREKLDMIFHEYIGYCFQNAEIDFWTRFYYFPPEPLKEEVQGKTHNIENVFKKMLQTIFEEGIATGEFRKCGASDMLVTYYYLLIGFVLSLPEYVNKDRNDDIQRALSVFWEGIIM